MHALSKVGVEEEVLTQTVACEDEEEAKVDAAPSEHRAERELGCALRGMEEQVDARYHLKEALVQTVVEVVHLNTMTGEELAYEGVVC